MRLAILLCLAATVLARDRAKDKAYKKPPPLAVHGWVGPPVDPRKPQGKVTAVVFFSLTHPSTPRVLERLVSLQRRWRARGVRIVGVAAVVDDHANQRPPALRARLHRLRLPFPVAVDRQRAGRASVSFRSYGGRALPWFVLIDRKGRTAWRGGNARTATALALFEAKLKELAAGH